MPNYIDFLKIQTCCCGGWLLESLLVSFWFLLFDGIDMLLFAFWLYIVVYWFDRSWAWISTNVNLIDVFIMIEISEISETLLICLTYSSIDFCLENWKQQLNNTFVVCFSFETKLIQHLIRCWLSCVRSHEKRIRWSYLAHCLLCCGDGVISSLNDSWHKLWIIHISGVFFLFSLKSLFLPVFFPSFCLRFFNCG